MACSPTYKVVCWFSWESEFWNITRESPLVKVSQFYLRGIGIGLLELPSGQTSNSLGDTKQWHLVRPPSRIWGAIFLCPIHGFQTENKLLLAGQYEVTMCQIIFNLQPAKKLLPRRVHQIFNIQFLILFMYNMLVGF